MLHGLGCGFGMLSLNRPAAWLADDLDGKKLLNAVQDSVARAAKPL